ncbi:unnamed protein product [Penicillium discolor]
MVQFDLDDWKAQFIGGVCGVLALALVVGAVIWIVRFHVRQARLKDPQMVLPRLAVLCDGPEADPSNPETKPHVQMPGSMSRVEFMAPYGLHLPHPPNVDPDILPAMKSAMKGKGKL